MQPGSQSSPFAGPRRQFLRQAGGGMGLVALAALTVAVTAVASVVTVGAPRPVTVAAPVAGTVTTAERRSAAMAKSPASWLSTRSAFSPVATPVAFVVNGAPVAFFVVIL